MEKYLFYIWHFFIPTLLIFSMSASALVYEVKPGDTLSEIVHSHIPGPVWGKRGSLVVVLSKNPKFSDQNVIFPGDKILINEDAEAVLTEKTTPACEAPQRKIASTEDSEIPSRLNLGVALGFSQITGIDPATSSIAKINSGTNFNANASWIQSWSEKYQSYVFVRVNKETYEPSSSTISISETDQTLSRFGMGSRAKISNLIDLNADLSVGQDLWYRAISATSLRLEKVTVPHIDLGATVHVVKLKQYQLDFVGQSGYLLGVKSGSYQLSGGYQYGLGLDLSEIRKTGSILKCGVHYSQAKQNATILKLERQNINFNCGWEWEW